MSAETETATATSESGGLNRGESVYSKEYRRLRKLTSTIEIQRQCVSEGNSGSEGAFFDEEDRQKLIRFGRIFSCTTCGSIANEFFIGRVGEIQRLGLN